MAQRPRILWQLLEQADVSTWWTPGWLPDSDVLRWSLANSLRVEGACNGWREAFSQAEAITVRESYVAEDDEGEWVEVTSADSSWPEFQHATIVRLETVED